MTVMRPNPQLPSATEVFDTQAKARFWMKASPAPADACWIWWGARGRSGYGNFGVGKKTYLAHRAAYELVNGPIPEGLDLDHLCRNKRCVNPSHLEPVTFLTNMRRRYGLDPSIEQKDYPGHEAAGDLADTQAHYRRWTAPELETAARLDLTTREIALKLGRTHRSVVSMRVRLGVVQEAKR